MAVSVMEEATHIELTPAGSILDISYAPKGGDISSRRVRILRWFHGRNGFTYFRAWCFLRGEERTFRADRVQGWEWANAEPRTGPVWAAPVPFPAPASPRARPGRRGGGRGLGWVAGIAAMAVIWALAAPQQERQAPAAVDERAAGFCKATGIADARLERMYARADIDGDGRLSWQELAEFQGALTRTFAYRSNPTVLRSDEFLARRGRDCDDWAAFTCGLLRYWGWEAYVGCYVPMDYDAVGGITNAMREDWRLVALYLAEAIYGAGM